ncbi:hypothetical protein TIFTF001_036403 [Ficus carica]|uniref:Uncharacterized protein n=1 Tax=Ficus carica TaxID=3494 RepID=A0AA88E3B0_FICCA|nr:hypothetical protein TIFTF001_036403 [Ficus carica]
MASPCTPADSSHGGMDQIKGGFFRKTVSDLFSILFSSPSLPFSSNIRVKNAALRVFSSGAIAKRIDVFTLETSDDVVIVIRVSRRKNSPSTTQCSSEITPTKKAHVIQEDRKEVEVLEGPSHKVSENISICSSQVSNLSSPHADEKRHEINVTPIGYRRCSEGLRNFKGNQKNPASSCSLKDEIRGSPTSGEIPVTLDDEKLNSSLSGTILSGKSPVHLSAKIISNTEEKRVIVCGLVGGNNNSTPLSVFSDPEDVLLQNELGSSKSKRGRKSKNANNKAAKETDAKEESTHRKKTERKIIYEKPVTFLLGVVIDVPLPSPEKLAKTFAVSPECSPYGRSRSGRLLLPTMEFWRNQIPVYDSDHSITRIQGDLPASVRGLYLLLNRQLILLV